MKRVLTVCARCERACACIYICAAMCMRMDAFCFLFWQAFFQFRQAVCVVAAL